MESEEDIFEDCDDDDPGFGTTPGPYHTLLGNIHSVLLKLQTARSILGNTTIIYTTSVANRNNRDSNDTDDFSVFLNIVAMVVIPLNLVACHWGMNCYVPGKEKSLLCFWCIVGTMTVFLFGALVYPAYAYAKGKMHLIT